MNLLPAGSNDVVDGIAVSPDGTSLAVAMQLYNSAAQQPQLARRDRPVLPDRRPDPDLDCARRCSRHAMESGLDQPQQAGVRLAGPAQGIGRLLLHRPEPDSRARHVRTWARPARFTGVLLKGGGQLGFIQSAGVGPDGSPINVATVRVTSIGGQWHRDRAARAGVTLRNCHKTFATFTKPYNGLQEEGAVSAPAR